MDQNGISIINGEYEATHRIPYNHGWVVEWDIVDSKCKPSVQCLISGMSMMVMLLEVQHTQIAHLYTMAKT